MSSFKFCRTPSIDEFIVKSRPHLPILIVPFL